MKSVTVTIETLSHGMCHKTEVMQEYRDWDSEEGHLPIEDEPNALALVMSEAVLKHLAFRGWLRHTLERLLITLHDHAEVDGFALGDVLGSAGRLLTDAAKR